MEQTMGYMRLLFTEPNYKKYKLLTYDGDNNEYSYIFDFSQDKVFHEDNIEIISPTTFKVKHSPVRKHNHLSGILILANNKTYGKHKDKFVYKCIPDNKYLPTFLVPYNKKNGFNKNTKNLYVTFKYNHWEKTHPY